MIKIISKKKYDSIIDSYVERNKNKCAEIHELELEIRRLNKENKAIECSNRTLIEENKKLIEWISTIIKEVGCYEVPEGNQIKIPVMKKEAFFNNDGRMGYRREEVRLPSITYQIYK